jgi:hypothetical protein
MIELTSEVTNVEAYTGAGMERGGILLEIRRDGQLAGLNLRQNEPNPWRSGTVIRYDLPQAGAVKVTIADVTGKIIKAYDTYGNTGENTMTITREQLNGATGVMIYKVESGTHTAQRKMLVIE